jgi:predicted small lipoprotein YifL
MALGVEEVIVVSDKGNSFAGTGLKGPDGFPDRERIAVGASPWL